MIRVLAILLVVAGFSVLSVALLSAGTPPGPVVDWISVDAGGGESTDGVLLLRGVVGQPDAYASSACNIRLRGGFLGGLHKDDLLILDSFEVPCDATP